MNGYKETISTDGAWATQLQLPHAAPSKTTEREIWLWDFAGQADYRLVHQLYMDETALAVFVFNPQDRNPFEGLAEWDRAIARAARRPFAKLLVAGRCDRGGLMVSKDVVKQFAQDHQFADWFETSALTGMGCQELQKAIVKHIPWNDIPWTASPDTFRRLKAAIIKLKDRTYARPKKGKARPRVLLSMEELGDHIRRESPDERFTEGELRAVVGLLHGPGIVWKLEFGDLVLLQPERINAYAAGVIHTVRKHVDDIGIIPEDDVLAGKLDFRDMERLTPPDENIVLRAMHQLFVGRGLCIRETGKKDGRVLVFPSLYTRERNPRDDYPNSVVSYRFVAHLDEVYTTLVVRLHHTEMFEKHQLWLDAADFRTPAGKLVGLKMTRLGEGRAEITAYAEHGVPDDTKVMFEKYVNEHLKEKDPEVKRVRHYVCVSPDCGQPHGDPRMIELARINKWKQVFCSACGKPIPIDDVLEQKFGSEKAAEKVREMEAEAQEKLDSESKELILVGHAYVISASAGQIYRSYTNSDHGIDGEIEFKTTKGQASGKRLYLQLKSGDSYLTERKRDETEVFTIKNERWADYWQRHAYPVMLVVRTSDGAIRWMEVSKYLKENSRGSQKVKQIVFTGEPFTAAALRQMRDQILGGR